jgi:hypothetical protein
VTARGAFHLAVLSASAMLIANALPVYETAPSESASSLVLFCSVDSPVIPLGGSVMASVLADAPDQASIVYKWTASEGAFLSADGRPSSEASGNKVEWSGKGVSAGLHKLSLTAHDGKAATGNCSLSVVVSDLERGSDNSSILKLARAFLARSVLEVPNYGLYSYVILPNECAGSQSSPIRDRCSILVKKALVAIKDEKDMKGNDFSTSQLNLTYLLVMHDIPPDIAGELDRNRDAQVTWILENYDYARCERLLFLLKESGSQPGPIIVSTEQPVFYTSAKASNKSQNQVPAHLVQDFSNIPPRLMDVWLDRFRNETTQERRWQPSTLDSLAYGLRKYLAIAGGGLPTVQSAIKAIGGK